MENNNENKCRICNVETEAWVRLPGTRGKTYMCGNHMQNFIDFCTKKRRKASTSMLAKFEALPRGKQELLMIQRGYDPGAIAVYRYDVGQHSCRNNYIEIPK